MDEELGTERKSERLSLRLGGMIISVLAFVLALPPGLLALIFADNVALSNWGHIFVAGGAWLALAWPILTGLACLVFPTRASYYAALLSCGWTLVAWGLWFMPTLSQGLIH
jgi:hypothetical protein